MRKQRLNILWLALLAMAANAADGPTFHATFDGTATATHSDGGPAEPTIARGLTFVPGLTGQAVYVGGFGDRSYNQAPLLEYDAGRHFAGDGGTVEFWVSPDWDGYFTDPVHFDWHFLFAALGGRDEPDFAVRDVAPNSGCDRLSLFMWNWLRGDLKGEPDKPATSLAWKCRNTWLQGDWWHIAITWRNDGWSKLYVNGVPQAKRAQPKLADSQRFYLGSMPKTWTRNNRANAAFDDLSIYPRALTEAEIQTEFRRIAPLDFTVEQRYLRAAQPEQFVFELTPSVTTTPVTGSLQVRILADADQRVVASEQFKLKVTGRQAYTVPVGKLPVGSYRAECVLTRPAGRFQRSFALTVYQQQAAPAASRDDVKLGERLVDLDCTGTDHGFVESTPSEVRSLPSGEGYREAGPNKWDRFGFEVNVPGADGSPVMLEVTWPDDRERAMSWYLLPKSDHPQHRDRLSGGVQAGGEYPNTGTMQTTRYLFYPTEEQYLLEVRTLIPELPAAVSRLQIYRLAERLPKLALDLPAGQTPRSFGHLDEDQSFEVLFGGPQDPGFPRSELRYGYPVQTFERLLDYLDYTGQNAMDYSLARYTWSHPDQGPVNNVGDGLRVAGWIDLLLDMMAQRGKQLLANVNVWTIPAPGASQEGFAERVKKGYYRVDRNGKAPMASKPDPGLGDNPSHPAVRAGFLKLTGELLRRYGKSPAFAGIDLWCNGRNPYLYGSLDNDYDDLTIAAFEHDTGLNVPAGDDPAGRFAARYRYLTGEARDRWLAWRVRQNTELLTEVDARVRRTRPELQLCLSIIGWYSRSPEFLEAEQCEDFDFTRFCYEDLGLDLAALKRLPSVVLVPMEDGTYDRWLKHWYGGRQNITGELNHNTGKFEVFRNGSRSGTSIYLRYFESFLKSLKQETYQGYFQNSDPKARGRYFLQDFAVALASQDASRILIGAQPLGTTGRDAVTREFASAYRALPVGDFLNIAKLRDPVTARYLRTSNGTYLYAVNLLWSPATVTLELPDAGQVTELSTGQAVDAARGRLALTLRPFELRSFRLSGRSAVPRAAGVTVPESTRAWFESQLAELARQVAMLKHDGAPTVAHEQRLAELRQRLADGRYADAHRLLCSKLLRGIPELRQAAADGSLRDQAAMIARSEYALNCGGSGFWRNRAGRLFFPDHAYRPGGYGYDGGHQSVGRSVRGMDPKEMPKLFATEAYDLDAYRFTVKPGKYTVRLYLRVGYEPGFQPGKFVLSIDLEGRRVLSDVDLVTACDSDFTKVYVREFNGIEVSDEVLDVEFSIPAGRGVDPTARLCDAIEVIPEG